jgi:hypothetical protein
MTMVGYFEPVVEAYLSSGWRDISADVRYLQGRGISIKCGSTSESSTIESRVQLTLDGRTGIYSPRYAPGTYYGSLKRYTPLRVGTRIVRDLFTSRAASNGWGNATQGLGGTYAWTLSGGAAGDYAVTAGVATHSLSSTASRITYLADVDMSNVEQRVTFQLPFSNTTGDAVAGSLIFRNTVGGFYRALWQVKADESVTVQWYDYGAVPLGAPVTVSGLTHSGQAIRVAAHMDGQTGRIKVWPAASVEPYTWTLEQDQIGVTLADLYHGSAGIESFKTSGNTNGTFSVSYSDYEVRSQRFEGEIARFPPVRDTTGQDTTVPVEASGVLRRYRNNGSVIKSSATRYASRAVNLLAHWPCEEGSGSAQFASSNAAWPAMSMTLAASGKLPQLASSGNLFVASSPLPSVKQSVWEGLVAPYTPPSPNVIQLTWLMNIDIDQAEPANNSTVIRLKNTGTAYYYILRYVTGGQLLLDVQDYFGTVLDSDAIAVETRWVVARGRLLLVQSGANVNWAVSVANLTTQTVSTVMGSTASQTIGTLGGVAVGDGGLDDVTMGQIWATSSVSGTNDYAQELYAWQGEAAPTRAYRIIHTEEGVPFQREGNFALGPTMGVQGPAASMQFLDLSQQVNQGLVVEPHFTRGVGYISWSELSNRTSRLSVDYAAFKAFRELPVVDDDQFFWNRVTASSGNRSNSEGSTATRSLDTGSLGTQAVESGGSGPVDKPITVNVNTLAELDNLAGYVLMQGTLDQPRTPQVTLYLHNPRVYADRAYLQACLDTREGQFYTVTNIPQTLSSDPVKSLAVGYEERLTQFEHELTLFGQPGDWYRSAVVASGSARVQASKLYWNANVTSTATSGAVKSLDGYLLSTTATPYDIVVGGERITLTAVTGAASPQTVTMTRSVNGVVKAHTADDSENARIRIYQAARVALSGN